MEETENSQKKSRIIIEIPSYKDVINITQSNSNPPSLFTPSQSFSQAFASIKNSEFYSPPPPPPTTTNNNNNNNTTENVPSSSNSNVPLSSRQSGVSTSSVQKSNAIFVSHRQSYLGLVENKTTPLNIHIERIWNANLVYKGGYAVFIIELMTCNMKPLQKGNPILKHIRNVKWNFAEVIPDYVLGQNSCALYLSLRYHLLHPDYLYFRIRELQKNFRLRVVLCHVDVEDVVKPLLEVTKTALLHDCTLLCAWSLEECGRYLETIKVYENKPADIIQGHMDTDYLSRLNHALTSVRHVNKTDVVTLGSTFGSLSRIMDASMEDLARCPGIGERKVKRLYDTFHEPFKRVMPIRPTIPEVPNESIPNSNSLNTEALSSEKEVQEQSKRQKKAPEVNIKSALSAAFSKYSDKLRKQKTQPDKEDSEGSAVHKESEADTEN